MVQDSVVVVVQVPDPGLDVTVYPMSTPPPSDVGRVHEIVAFVFNGTATTLVGAVGIAEGVTTLLIAAIDDPVPLVAMTVKLTGTPLVRPTTVQVSSPSDEQPPPLGTVETV